MGNPLLFYTLSLFMNWKKNNHIEMDNFSLTFKTRSLSFKWSVGIKVVKDMNIIKIPFMVEAKTMGNQKTKNVSYYFNQSPLAFV